MSAGMIVVFYTIIGSFPGHATLITHVLQGIGLVSWAKLLLFTGGLLLAI